MERFLKGIDYMEAHLPGRLTLEDVASAAALSPYHFARTFRVLTGETVMGYVRRRRLVVAAERLSQTGGRILDVALDVGFESQEAFTRAFKRQFGVTPGEWVRLGRKVSAEARAGLDRSFLKHRKDHIVMEPTFKEMSEIKVIGMMATFNDETKQGIPDLWGQFAPRIGEIAQRIDTATYGVCFPSAVKGDEIDYMAAIGVEHFDAIPEGMIARTIPPHRYAVFTHKTSDESLHDGIQKTAHFIWGVWLPNSKFQQATAPDFELYDERFDPVTQKGELDFCIPIE